MRRNLIYQLELWKNNSNRKPLLLQGARQVGKSYLLENFGENWFDRYHLFNFERNPELATIFETDFDPKRILDELSLLTNKPINIQSDLIIFDEIQECPKALNSLKYFYEAEEDYYLCCAGSLLGVALSSESFPVGKVTFLNLYPLNFHEFLYAAGNEQLISLYNETLAGKNIPEIGHSKIWNLLKDYYVTGGMPEVVTTYFTPSRNRFETFNEVRKLQEAIITGYYKDISKHSGKTNATHISTVLENIPKQLAQNHDYSVKRYKFKDVVPKAKGFTTLEGPISWLEKAGLVIKVSICNRAEIPLELFSKPNIFKLFLFDIGLLGAILQIPPGILIADDYGTAKGYFAENFVAQELVAAGATKLHSWTERNSEIEFLLIRNDRIIPLEVKAGTRTQAKSLQQFIKKYLPGESIILSARQPAYNTERKIRYLPLYLAGTL